MTHHRIGVRLVFDGRLDAERLRRASRLALDAEPVVGTSLLLDVPKPFWRRMGEVDSSRSFSFLEADDVEAAMDAFQAAEVGDEGPQAKVALFRSGDGDEVGIKVSHVLADGQATKQYAYLIADIYTRLGDDPAYEPIPNLMRRQSAADVWSNLTEEQRRDAKKAKSWSKPTWPVPAKGRTGEGLTYRAVSTTGGEFASLKEYGRRRESTVNDMMLTAVFRACCNAFDPPERVPHALMCTADLRRFLADSKGLPISNISISGSMDIERVRGESFDETLARVRERVRLWARACYGVGPMYRAERMAERNYRLMRAFMRLMLGGGGNGSATYLFFTNIGILDHERLGFGGLTPVSACMYGPAPKGASVVPVISTYRDTLTVSSGFCERDIDEAVVLSVLEGAFEELDSAGCLGPTSEA